MTDPGWYYSTGDPEGTQRYWDGTTWVGEPKVPGRADDIVYYAAASDAPVDLGDVATRVSLADTEPSRSYAQSPYSATKASVNVRRRPPIPEGLKNLTILVCVLKAIPLILLGLGFVRFLGGTALGSLFGSRYGPPLLDLDASRGAAILLLGVLFFLGSSLVIIQGRAAVNDDASSLFSVAMVMLVIDLLNTLDQYISAARGQGYGPSLLVTLVLGLQALVTVWAGIQTRKKHL